MSDPPQQGCGISLAPEGDLKGGAHVPKPKTKKLGAYREFVRNNLKQHGGDMKAVAAMYRQQGSGHCGCKSKQSQYEMSNMAWSM